MMKLTDDDQPFRLVDTVILRLDAPDVFTLEEWQTHIVNVMGSGWDLRKAIVKVRLKFIRWSMLAGVGYSPASEMCDQAEAFGNRLLQKQYPNPFAYGNEINWADEQDDIDRQIEAFYESDPWITYDDARSALLYEARYIRSRLFEIAQLAEEFSPFTPPPASPPQPADSRKPETPPAPDVVPPLPEGTGPLDPDCSSFSYRGKVFTFNPTQAKFIQRIFQAHQVGEEGLLYRDATTGICWSKSPLELFRGAGNDGQVDRNHPAWGSLIQTKGATAGDRRRKIVFLDLG